MGSYTPITNYFTRIDNKNIFALSDWMAGEFGINKDTAELFLKENECLF